MLDSTITIPCGASSLVLKNPIITASGTFGYGIEFMPYGDIATLGAICLKGISLKPREGNPMPRIAEVEGGLLNAIGLQNCGVDYLSSKILPQLQKTGATVIANLYANSATEFAELASVLVKEPAIHALEVNVSCPNVTEGGIAFGQNEDMLADVVKSVADVSKDTVVAIKLTPNITNIVRMAQIAEDNGANAISCINTLSGMAVDIRTRKPRLSTIYGGLSGQCIKPVALQCVHKIAQAVNIPVIGMGGISSATDVLEFILVGATAVQVGTATFMNPTFPFQLMHDVQALCEELGIERLEEYRNTLLL